MSTVNEMKELRDELQEITDRKQQIKEIVEERRLKASENTDEEQDIIRLIRLEQEKLQRFKMEVEQKKRIREENLEHFFKDNEQREKIEKLKTKKSGYTLLIESDKKVYEMVTKDILSKGKGISKQNLQAMI